MANNLMRFDPFEEMRSLQKQFFGDDWFTTPLHRAQVATTDIYTENDKQMVVEAHLPNFSDKDIDIHVENGDLVIQGEKTQTEKDKDKKYVVRESSASFYRRVHLPAQADESKIDAEMSQGVLKITVPFKQLPKPKRVTIKAKNK